MTDVWVSVPVLFSSSGSHSCSDLILWLGMVFRLGKLTFCWCNVASMNLRKGETTCYQCNEPLTDETWSADHIPPQCLFAKTERNCNLITVPCCAKCNHGHHREDDFLLLLIFDTRKKKVVEMETFKRAIKTLGKGTLQKYRRNYLEKLLTETPDHVTQAPIHLPIDRKAVFCRMVKGLLYKFYGVRGFDGYEFNIIEVEPEFRDQILADTPERFVQTICKGNGVFRVDCFVEASNPIQGLFFLQFFESYPIGILFQKLGASQSRKKGDFPALDQIFGPGIP